MFVRSIQFNHDLGSARRDAINIRRNASEPVTLPEWRRENPGNPADVVAAYAIGEIGSDPLQIEVRFERTEGTPATVQVRAVEPPRPQLPWWLRHLPHPSYVWIQPTYLYNPVEYYRYLVYTHYYRISQAWRTAETNVLGEVKPATVRFENGQAGATVLMELQNTRLASRGVGVSEVAWLWQYRTGARWIDVEITRHRVCAVLSLPTEPWTQEPFEAENTQLPWSEVLAVACDWATGALTHDDAARRVTQSVYALGESVLQYGCPISAPEMYAVTLYKAFNCTAFLNRLRGGVGMGPYVNCTDCAAIVSTFANSLGCDLWQSSMGTSLLHPFRTNPIRIIGIPWWQSPCGLDAGFSFHEVAWKGEARAPDEVYDACLAIDLDATPGAWPFRPAVPANMRFGEPNDGGYRDRLVVPEDRHLCRPRPQARLRRRVF